jgi:predicted ester cyclase
MDAAQREAQIRRFVDQVWNGRRYEAAGELYADSYSNPLGTGPSAKTDGMRRYHQAFPDLRVDIDEIVVAGDTAVLRFTLHGSDTGGFIGRPATGRTVEQWGVSILRFDGDRVVSEWMGSDKLGLFIQLGAVDDPWVVPAAADSPAG